MLESCASRKAFSNWVHHKQYHERKLQSRARLEAATVYIGFLTWRMELEEIIQAASWEMQERGEDPPLQPETFVAEKLPEVVLQLQQAIR